MLKEWKVTKPTRGKWWKKVYSCPQFFRPYEDVLYLRKAAAVVSTYLEEGKACYELTRNFPDDFGGGMHELKKALRAMLYDSHTQSLYYKAKRQDERVVSKSHRRIAQELGVHRSTVSRNLVGRERVKVVQVSPYDLDEEELALDMKNHEGTFSLAHTQVLPTGEKVIVRQRQFYYYGRECDELRKLTLKFSKQTEAKEKGYPFSVREVTAKKQRSDDRVDEKSVGVLLLCDQSLEWELLTKLYNRCVFGTVVGCTLDAQKVIKRGNRLDNLYLWGNSWG